MKLNWHYCPQCARRLTHELHCIQCKYKLPKAIMTLDVHGTTLTNAIEDRVNSIMENMLNTLNDKERKFLAERLEGKDSIHESMMNKLADWPFILPDPTKLR